MSFFQKARAISARVPAPPSRVASGPSHSACVPVHISGHRSNIWTTMIGLESLQVRVSRPFFVCPEQLPTARDAYNFITHEVMRHLLFSSECGGKPARSHPLLTIVNHKVSARFDRRCLSFFILFFAQFLSARGNI